MKIIKVSDEVHEHIMEKKGDLSASQFIESLLERQVSDKVVSEFSELDRNQLKYIESLVMDVKNIVLEHTPPEKNVSEAMPYCEAQVGGMECGREVEKQGQQCSIHRGEPDWGA